jgi:hypothetical protein
MKSIYKWWLAQNRNHSMFEFVVFGSMMMIVGRLQGTGVYWLSLAVAGFVAFALGALGKYLGKTAENLDKKPASPTVISSDRYVSPFDGAACRRIWGKMLEEAEPWLLQVQFEPFERAECLAIERDTIRLRAYLLTAYPNNAQITAFENALKMANYGTYRVVMD